MLCQFNFAMYIATTDVIFLTLGDNFATAN